MAIQAEVDRLGVKIAEALGLDPNKTTYINLHFSAADLVTADVGYIVHKGELDDIDWTEMVPAEVNVNVTELE